MVSLAMLLAAGYVAVLLLATVKCDVQSFKQHMEAEKRMKLMMDPSANFKYFKHEDDITYLMPEFYEQFGHEERSKRLTRKNTVRWENGAVPYTMSESYSGHERNVILMALSHYEEKTCLRFIERTNEVAYVTFYPGAGCRSFIGKQRQQPQGVSLSRSCLREFHLVLHEIGHAIGLLHEHTRPDRDDYVDVLYENIYSPFIDQFDKEDEDKADTLGVGYDYNSVMHYKPDAFKNHSTPGITIRARNPGIPVGPGNALSELDVRKINRLYYCSDNVGNHPPRSTIYIPSKLPDLPPLKKECGKRLDEGMNGTITSPGYPEHQANQDCEWQIKVPSGFQIRLDFITIDLPQSNGCQNCYMEIFDSPDCTGFSITRGKLCSFPRYSYYYSFGNKACVRYYCENPSDDEDRTGFKIKFTADDEDECFFPTICDHKCTNFPGGYYCTCPEGYFLAPDGQRCFDVNECALGGHMCEHKCENFGGYHECICQDGSLQVGDSCEPPAHPTTAHPTTAHPTTAHPTTVRPTTAHPTTVRPTTARPTTARPTTVRPTTARPTTAHSTTAHPTTLPPTTEPITLSPQCGSGPAVHRDSQGFMETLGWSAHQAYPTNTVCRWRIECPSSQKVKLSFSSPFRIAGQMPSCSKDQLRIWDCDGQISHGPFCHIAPPEPRTSQCNAVEVEFDAGSERGSSRYGFRLNYACEPASVPLPSLPPPALPIIAATAPPKVVTLHPTTAQTTTLPPTAEPITLSPQCGSGPEVRRDSPGFVETLGWSAHQAYPTNTVCRWKIECPSSQKVRLFFSNTFRIAGQMPSCPKDQLRIWDCNGQISHGPFCHLTPPEPRTSECNAVEVEFDAGSRRGSTRYGFRLNYECM